MCPMNRLMTLMILTTFQLKSSCKKSMKLRKKKGFRDQNLISLVAETVPKKRSPFTLKKTMKAKITKKSQS